MSFSSDRWHPTISSSDCLGFHARVIDGERTLPPCAYALASICIDPGTYIVPEIIHLETFGKQTKERERKRFTKYIYSKFIIYKKRDKPIISPNFSLNDFS